MQEYESARQPHKPRRARRLAMEGMMSGTSASLLDGYDFEDEEELGSGEQLGGGVLGLEQGHPLSIINLALKQRLASQSPQPAGMQTQQSPPAAPSLATAAAASPLTATAIATATAAASPMASPLRELATPTPTPTPPPPFPSIAAASPPTSPSPAIAAAAVQALPAAAPQAAAPVSSERPVSASAVDLDLRVESLGAAQRVSAAATVHDDSSEYPDDFEFPTAPARGDESQALPGPSAGPISLLAPPSKPDGPRKLSPAQLETLFLEQMRKYVPPWPCCAVPVSRLLRCQYLLPPACCRLI